MRKQLCTLLLLSVLILSFASSFVGGDIITTNNFILNIPSGQSRTFMDLANGVNITLTVTAGTLNSGNTSFNTNVIGGSLYANSSTAGIIQVTSSSASFYLYLNGVYSSTNTFTFTPNTAFTITWAYSSLSVAVSPDSWLMDLGQSKTFSAVASGGSGVYASYQWYVGGVAQVGETASTFNYTPATTGIKYITASVTDSLGVTSLNSSSAVVTVNYAPTVRVSPYLSTLDVGDTQVFTISVTNGTGVYGSYKWYVNGSLQSTTALTYTFTATTNGTFLITASATDSAGITSLSSASTVTVNTAPVVTPTPTPAIPSTPTPTPITPTITPIPIHVGGSDTWYFRSDTYTTLDVSGYGLDSDYTNSYVTINGENAGNVTIDYGFQVYLFSSDRHISEITSGPSGVISLDGNFTGLSSGNFAMPKTAVVLGYEAIQVNVLMRFDNGTWFTVARFVTPVLITNNVLASTWTFNLYVNNTQADGTTYTSFSFGDSTYQSSISGVSLQQPLESELNAWRLSQGDLIGFFVGSYVDVMGEAIYALILFAIAGSMYRRFGHFGPIAFFFIIFGGIGGVVWVFVPLWAAVVVATFVIIGTTFIVWRIIR